MRISDWSSDVCSSDLVPEHRCWGGLGRNSVRSSRAARNHPPRGCPPPAMVRRTIDLPGRSEEHTSELQSLMRISYAVFCLKKKKIKLKGSNEATWFQQNKNE